MFEYTGCDGIMISRASLGRPWIFEEVQNYLSGKDNIEVSNEDKLNTILKHIDLEIKDKGEYTGIREMRKHICFYLKGMPNASEIRNEINHLEDRGEIEKRLKEFFKNI